MDYHITWRIELEAESFEEAAQIAQQIQRDPNSIATLFEVKDASGTLRELDIVPTEEGSQGHEQNYRTKTHQV